MTEEHSKIQNTSRLADALALDPRDAVELFRELAPPPSDFAGEFKGHVPDYLREDWAVLMKKSGFGIWLGKGFLTEGHGNYPGWGYNIYSKDGVSHRQLEFAWAFDESSIDGLPALVMYYRAFRNWAGKRDLIDEIRTLEPGRYLGLFHTSEAVPHFTCPGPERSATGFFILESRQAAF